MKKYLVNENLVNVFRRLAANKLPLSKDEKGLSTIELLIITIVIIGLLITVFKPQITTTFTNALGIWNTDVISNFNNAQ